MEPTPKERQLARNACYAAIPLLFVPVFGCLIVLILRSTHAELRFATYYNVQILIITFIANVMMFFGLVVGMFTLSIGTIAMVPSLIVFYILSIYYLIKSARAAGTGDYYDIPVAGYFVTRPVSEAS